MSFGTFIGDMKLSMIKHSPEILMFAGGVSMVAAIVSAFKARPKYEEILDEYEEIKERRKAGTEKAERIEEATGIDVYTEEERMGDKIRDGIVFGMKMACVFGKTILFGVGAGVCFLAAFKIINGRYLGAVAVAAGAQSKLRAMEAAAVAEVGEGGLQRIKDNLAKEELENHLEETEDGKMVPTKAPTISRFAKFFDEMNPNFIPGDPEANIAWLRAKERTLNVRLQAKGYLFENEVWHELGIPKTQSGQTYGIMAKNPDGTTNALDLGIYSYNNRLAVNGYDDTILLEPNFDLYPIIERVGYEANMKGTES